MSIIAALDATDTTSEVQSGLEVIGQSGEQMIAAAQVVYRGVTTGNFSVVLEAQAAGSGQWGEVATIDQDSVNLPIVLTVARNLAYRFRHASGVNVTAYLA